MNTLDVKKQHLNDILFQNRNKSYGAYVLRKLYDGHVLKASLLASILFVSSFLLPKLFAKAANHLAINKNTVVELLPPPPMNDAAPPPPPPPPPTPKVATIIFLPPKVVIDAKVLKEEIPPQIEDLKGKVISDKNQEGDPNAHEVVKESHQEVVAPPPPPEPKEVVKPVAPDVVFHIVEQMPMFAQGEAAMFKYLSENIKYPTVAKENGIEGTVYLGFVVDTEGNITNVTVKRGVNGGCTEEAIRVVKGMPQWKAGKQQGRTVKVNFTLPIKFKLD